MSDPLTAKLERLDGLLETMARVKVLGAEDVRTPLLLGEARELVTEISAECAGIREGMIELVALLELLRDKVKA